MTCTIAHQTPQGLAQAPSDAQRQEAKAVIVVAAPEMFR
jgi:hypothetical protein